MIQSGILILNIFRTECKTRKIVFATFRHTRKGQ